MLRFLTYLMVITMFLLIDRTVAQNSFRLDRYEFSAGEAIQLRLDISGASFSYNSITIEPGLFAGISAESVVLTGAKDQTDIWLTGDSALFHSAGNSQTALVRKTNTRLLFSFFREISPGEQVGILINLGIPKKYNVAGRKSENEVLSVTLSHTSFTDRRQKLLPAKQIIIKP